MIEQFIENCPYSVFPQTYATQRPDIVQANLAEGKIAILLVPNSGHREKRWVRNICRWK